MATMTPQDAKLVDNKWKRRANIASVLLTVTTIASILLGLLGIKLNSQLSDANEQLSQAHAQATANANAVAQANVTINILSSQVASLQAQASQTTTPGPATTGPTPQPTTTLPPQPTNPAAGAPRRDVTMTLLPTTPQMDLDSTADNWSSGQGDGLIDGPGLQESYLSTYSSGAKLQLMPKDATDSDCLDLADSAASLTSIPLGSLSTGSNLCILTTAHRRAIVTILGDATPNKTPIRIRVWQK